MNKPTEQHPGNQKEKLIIFDTTLRDGEQALAASLTIREKLRIALALESLGVDVIEAGFPVSSPADFESVQQIAAIVKNSTICGLARCVTRDIETAAAALSAADQFRLHVFLATSDLHIESKLRKNFDDILEMAQKSIHIARKFTDDVEFSCEDAGRTSPDNLCRIVEHAIKSGATTINIPDTVGYTVPSQFGKIIADLYQRVPNIDKAIISVHCHDDLGMSVANSISAIEAGARQVEGTLNGIGERAGNCALEEIIMALRVRSDHFNVATNINCEKLHRTSNLVSQICNMPIPANKAIVGSNAFSHSSGIHQDGVLKNRETYEILTPESIGIKNVKLNLTSRSGRAAVRNAMAEMGYSDSKNDYNLENLYADFLTLADRKGQVFDYDLEALAFIGSQKESTDYFELKNLSYQTNNESAQAEIILHCGETSHLLKATGNGPIDAVFKAIQSKMDFHCTLESCVMQAKGIGRDALGQVDVCLKYQERTFHGIGLATDTIEAATQAFISALNHIHRSLIVSQYKNKSEKNKGSYSA